MSYINSRRFVILSSNINTSNDVFDRLIDVKDSMTGEEGVLLCSHMCSFPSSLVNQATLLAGCKPTSKWENDDRLALGYHPDHYIQWRVFAETKEIELYLTGGFINPEAEEYLHTNLPFVNTYFGGSNNTTHNAFSKALIRLAKSVLLDTPSGDVDQESLNNFECLIHRLFNSGRIDAWTASVFPSSMLTRHLHRDVYCDTIHWEGAESMFFDKQIWTVKADNDMTNWLEIEGNIVLEHTFVPYVDGGFESRFIWSEGEFKGNCCLKTTKTYIQNLRSSHSRNGYLEF